MFLRTVVVPAAHQPVRRAPRGTRSQTPPIPMDAWRADDRFVMAFDLPGVPTEAIDVEVVGRVVTVRAERRPAPRGEDARSLAGERAHGVFTRRIELAETVDADRIEAHVEHGVLTLTAPVVKAAAHRKIAVPSLEPRPSPATEDTTA